MLIEKFVFNILAISLFVIIFSKLIRKNDTNYVFILVLEAIGIAFNFLELLIGGFFASAVMKVLMYLFSIIIPLVVVVYEYAGNNFSEVLSVFFSKILIWIGDKQAAKDVLLAMIEKYPDTYKGHIKLAEIYEKDGDYKRAIDEYVLAVDNNQRDYDSFYKIAVLLNEQNQRNEAIEMLHRLLESKPEYYNASIMLGELLCGQGRFKEAVSVYQDALKYKPSDFELYYSLGIAYTRLNDFASAKDAYEKAAEINHRAYAAKYSLAQIALIEKDLDAAEEHFQECLMSEELEPKAYYQLAKIYLVKEEKDKAIIFANKAIELDNEYIKIIGHDPAFKNILEYLDLSIHTLDKVVKKEKKRDENIHEYMDETIHLIINLNENEKNYRVNKKVDKIFENEGKRKEIESFLEEPTKVLTKAQKEFYRELHREER